MPPVQTAELPTFALDDVDGMAEAIRTEGVAFIPGVLSKEEVEAARAAVDRCQHFGFDSKTDAWDHYKCVFNRERLWLSYLDRPGVVDLADRLMGEQCHIIGMTAWRSRPGYTKDRNVHVDRLFMEVPEQILDDPNVDLPVYICTAHYYLDDIDIDLCPTWVLPGSHRSGRRPAPDEAEWRGRQLQPVLCKAGDVLFFRSEVWHSGSNNTSDRTRYLVQVHYSQRDIAQKFSPFPFTFNPEILSVANERQLRLLGRHPESAYG